jgi:hypothetical protein
MRPGARETLRVAWTVRSISLSQSKGLAPSVHRVYGRGSVSALGNTKKGKSAVRDESQTAMTSLVEFEL